MIEPSTWIINQTMEEDLEGGDELPDVMTIVKGGLEFRDGASEKKGDEVLTD